MGRFRQVAHNIASSYAVLVVTAVYALASLPLALHYLSKERFGLWTLMGSISGYLSLIDLGMSGSVARLLIDHKTERDGQTYGSLIKTGWLVLGVQALFVISASWFLASPLSNALRIPPEFRNEFIALMKWQGGVVGLSFGLRIFNHILQAHQRLDIISYSQMVSLALSFALLWIFFKSGHGVFSLVWASLISSFSAALICLTGCSRLKLFPAFGAWGRASWDHFKEIFDYGKDMFLVAVGTQLIMASQTLIITRHAGLGDSAAWNAGTRAFNLICQAIWRISDASGPALSEMIVRKEQGILRERYRAMLILTGSISAFAAIAYAMCNGDFVTILTHHKITWESGNDLLLGIWMVVLALLHCHNGFVLLTKNIGFMRYIYFLEGGVFVIAAILTSKWGGLTAIIICSIVCSTSFSGAYGIWRISDYFNLRVWEVGVRWLVPMGRVLALFGPVAFICWWSFRGVPQEPIRLAIYAVFSIVPGLYILLRYGLAPAFQRELLQRAPKKVNPILRRVFVGISR
jgi:O-antigen/teichoic acid export membrane protein